MALVFFRDPVTPLQAAVQIARALKSGSALQLRMGIHSGPVYRVEDINANANVSGGGINTTQRVMDVGDSGHILVSAAVAELVRQVGAWPLIDLGECEVKHGQRLHLFNVCGADFGNPVSPSRLQRPLSGNRKVVLLYRRDAQPDEEVLESLASHFATRLRGVLGQAPQGRDEMGRGDPPPHPGGRRRHPPGFGCLDAQRDAG
jgi:hypothetical protein